MKPARIDWLHRSNEQFKFRIVLAKGDGTPFDLSVYDDLRLQVKADRLQPEPELELALGDGLTLESGGSNGAINGESAVAMIDDLNGVYSYDILGTTTAGRADVVCEGVIEFVQGVTVT